MRRTTDVARSPAALGLAGAGAGVGLLASLPIAATAGVALTGYAAGVAVSLLRRRRRPRPVRIDPFTVGETWRIPVKSAMQASARYSQLLGSLRPGPLRERLVEIGRSVDRGVEECWRVARRGDELTSALAALDVATTRARLARADAASAGDVVRSLEAQVASAERLESVAEKARLRLLALEARLHEAVATAVELSQRAEDDAGAARLGSDVDDVVDQLSALRSALDETAEIGQ